MTPRPGRSSSFENGPRYDTLQFTPTNQERLSVWGSGHRPKPVYSTYSPEISGPNDIWTEPPDEFYERIPQSQGYSPQLSSHRTQFSSFNSPLAERDRSPLRQVEGSHFSSFPEVLPLRRPAFPPTHQFGSDFTHTTPEVLVADDARSPTTNMNHRDQGSRPGFGSSRQASTIDRFGSRRSNNLLTGYPDTDDDDDDEEEEEADVQIAEEIVEAMKRREGGQDHFFAPTVHPSQAFNRPPKSAGLPRKHPQSNDYEEPVASFQPDHMQVKRSGFSQTSPQAQSVRRQSTPALAPLSLELRDAYKALELSDAEDFEHELTSIADIRDLAKLFVKQSPENKVIYQRAYMAIKNDPRRTSNISSLARNRATVHHQIAASATEPRQRKAKASSTSNVPNMAPATKPRFSTATRSGLNKQNKRPLTPTAPTRPVDAKKQRKHGPFVNDSSEGEDDEPSQATTSASEKRAPATRLPSKPGSPSRIDIAPTSQQHVPASLDKQSDRTLNLYQLKRKIDLGNAQKAQSRDPTMSRENRRQLQQQSPTVPEASLRQSQSDTRSSSSQERPPHARATGGLPGFSNKVANQKSVSNAEKRKAEDSGSSTVHSAIKTKKVEATTTQNLALVRNVQKPQQGGVGNAFKSILLEVSPTAPASPKRIPAPATTAKITTVPVFPRTATATTSSVVQNETQARPQSTDTSRQNVKHGLSRTSTPLTMPLASVSTQQTLRNAESLKLDCTVPFSRRQASIGPGLNAAKEGSIKQSLPGSKDVLVSQVARKTVPTPATLEHADFANEAEKNPLFAPKNVAPSETMTARVTPGIVAGELPIASDNSRCTSSLAKEISSDIAQNDVPNGFEEEFVTSVSAPSVTASTEPTTKGAASNPDEHPNPSANTAGQLKPSSSHTEASFESTMVSRSSSSIPSASVAAHLSQAKAHSHLEEAIEAVKPSSRKTNPLVTPIGPTLILREPPVGTAKKTPLPSAGKEVEAIDTRTSCSSTAHHTPDLEEAKQTLAIAPEMPQEHNVQTEKTAETSTSGSQNSTETGFPHQSLDRKAISESALPLADTTHSRLSTPMSIRIPARAVGPPTELPDTINGQPVRYFEGFDAKARRIGDIRIKSVPDSCPETVNGIPMIYMATRPPRLFEGEAEAYLQYAIQMKTWGDHEDESKVEPLEVCGGRFTVVDIANDRAEQSFKSECKRYTHAFAFQFLNSSTTRDEHDLAVCQATFAPINTWSKKMHLKVWVVRSMVSHIEAATDPPSPHTPYIPKMVYALRLYKLIDNPDAPPLDAESDGEAEEPSEQTSRSSPEQSEEESSDSSNSSGEDSDDDPDKGKHAKKAKLKAAAAAKAKEEDGGKENATANPNKPTKAPKAKDIPKTLRIHQPFPSPRPELYSMLSFANDAACQLQLEVTHPADSPKPLDKEFKRQDDIKLREKANAQWNSGNFVPWHAFFAQRKIGGLEGDRFEILVETVNLSGPRNL
ncbi:hypothetical protein CC80DRAFT_574246 [Byssothecium circinans]|uniref:Uncharacterized protein n=1 Tax=Byssothecium circinans TaxID=147558 RepID=A0A6A5U939_9PLEO|nr:hypothetical protein CC80DRAFT_574246 [Byssothecium circinans]